MKMNKILSMLLAATIIGGTSIPAFASDYSKGTTVSIDMSLLEGDSSIANSLTAEEIQQAIKDDKIKVCNTKEMNTFPRDDSNSEGTLIQGLTNSNNEIEALIQSVKIFEDGSFVINSLTDEEIQEAINNGKMALFNMSEMENIPIDNSFYSKESV
ncbi:hypothetical protein [Clostridium sp. ZS1]|uniref:hypothetical protein n=1 Tax=Clostridium sp. ZS1 TaxID=2949989 RepID=UPI002079F0E2|nr:hypothetical protein [Clostridium sp. ZS1]